MAWYIIGDPVNNERFLLKQLTYNEYVCTESSDWDQLTLEDLISYSFQVAKGMEFLASRKVILKHTMKVYLLVYYCMHTDLQH